ANMRGWKMAALFAATYQVTDPDFLYYTLYIHPDTLQMFFGLCAFVFGVAHANDGARKSLFALGFFCGIVQGTKVGAPWILPMALAALWLGWQAYNKLPGPASWGAPIDLRALRERLVILALAAVLGFFISTPYAFLDSYYLSSMLSAFGANNADHLQQKNSVT